MYSTSRLAGIAVLAMLTATAMPAIAQNAAAPAKKDAAPAAAPASAAKKELVKKALQLQQAGIESVGAGLASQTAGQVLQMAGPALSRVPEDKRQGVVNDLQSEVRKFQNDVTPMLKASAVKQAPSTLGAALEEKFSEDELKTLITWLESPVSRKYAQISAEAQQAMIQKVVADTRPQIEPKLKALEQAMVNKLNAATGGPGAMAPKPGDGAPKK
jgi:hypothetical protein